MPLGVAVRADKDSDSSALEQERAAGAVRALRSRSDLGTVPGLPSAIYAVKRELAFEH